MCHDIAISRASEGQMANNPTRLRAVEVQMAVAGTPARAAEGLIGHDIAILRPSEGQLANNPIRLRSAEGQLANNPIRLRPSEGQLVHNPIRLLAVEVQMAVAGTPARAAEGLIGHDIAVPIRIEPDSRTQFLCPHFISIFFP